MNITKNKLLQILFSIIISFSFAFRSLLGLPFFYEQNKEEQIRGFFLLSLIIFFLILLFNHLLIHPHLGKLQHKREKLFLIIMTGIILVVLLLSSASYWSIPEVHDVQMCFDASDKISSLSITGLINSNTKRLYPPESFGFSRYPIILRSEDCLDGRITMLLSELTQGLFSKRLIIRVPEDPPSGRFFVSINEVPSVINFSTDTDKENINEIIFDEGFDQGRRITRPWGQHWFILIKMLAVILCALYISLLLFGFNEQIINFQRESIE